MQNHKITAIWGVRLLDEGFTQIPNLLIRNYRKLGIEHGEFGFICTILTYQHDTRDPYPSLETLADHLGVSTKQIQKWIKSLKEKGLLIVGRRPHNVNNGHFAENVYNFQPLIQALLNLVGDKSVLDISDHDVVYLSEPEELEVGLDTEPEELEVEPEEPEVVDPQEPEVLEPEELQVGTKIIYKNTHQNTHVRKYNYTQSKPSHIQTQRQKQYAQPYSRNAYQQKPIAQPQRIRDERYARFYQLFPDC
jgi:DNA-binding transcriptional regulator YhcF (GntR family)